MVRIVLVISRFLADFDFSQNFILMDIFTVANWWKNTQKLSRVILKGLSSPPFLFKIETVSRINLRINKKLSVLNNWASWANEFKRIKVAFLPNSFTHDFTNCSLQDANQYVILWKYTTSLLMKVAETEQKQRKVLK